MASGPYPGGGRINWLPLVLGIIAALIVVASGWQLGPFGRHQIVALNPQQEAQLGAQAYRQILDQSNVVPEGPLVEQVRQIGRRLADASQDRDVLEALQLKPQRFAWDFHVVRSPEVNAFCLPGGKVVVYTGIIPMADTDAGLATVLGHEIGHALAHHGAERMAQEKLVQIGQQAVASSFDSLDPGQRRQLMGLIGAGSKFGILLPYSRKHESEADHIGILLMAKAGYDPRGRVLAAHGKPGRRSGTARIPVHPSQPRAPRPRPEQLASRSDAPLQQEQPARR
jgi:predicted Zn-dependent protease